MGTQSTWGVYSWPAMKVLILLLAAISAQGCVPKFSPQPACTCGLPLDKRRIIGGVSAKTDQYPWQVALMQGSNSQDSFCGGTLLSSDTVLTAAHCVFSSSVYVGIPQGDVTLQSSRNIRSSQILIHPYYSSSGIPNYDFAIIKLSSPVEFSDSVQPICLPNPNESYDDTLAEVAGWGNTDANGYNFPESLQTVNVTTMTNKQCQEDLEKIQIDVPYKITSNMICAAALGKNTCNGDSGGPLITLSKDGSHYSQIGVVSWGVANETSWGLSCSTTSPGVYSRVTDQLYWIIKQVSGDTCAPPTF